MCVAIDEVQYSKYCALVFRCRTEQCSAGIDKACWSHTALETVELFRTAIDTVKCSQIGRNYTFVLHVQYKMAWFLPKTACDCYECGMSVQGIEA